MPTKALNNKSRKVEARITLAIFEQMMQQKRADENMSQFITAALENEIARRKQNHPIDKPKKQPK